jgi:hypothetical protein
LRARPGRYGERVAHPAKLREIAPRVTRDPEGGLASWRATANSAAKVRNGEQMTGFYRPPLDGFEESPFARDGEDRLIRREYWLGLSDRSLVMLMMQGIGTRLTADEKRAHLKDIRREHLADQILAPEILPPER